MTNDSRGDPRTMDAAAPEEERAVEAVAPDEQPAEQGNADMEAPADDLAAALEASRAEAAQLKDQLLRALAETENVRRRAQRDREDASKFAVTGFAKDLLPVADNLRRALESLPAEAIEENELLKTLSEGVEMTERQLQAAFERHNIRKIEPLGEKFDSNLHQAMFEVPGSGEPAGTVVQLLQSGYLLNDRLLRPAMVGVAKSEPAPSASDGNGPGGNGNGAGDSEPSAPGGRVDTTA
ncbi:nucleotide exchange factor GrpE [Rhodospirillaceae bacterium SYSU D60014]|uniref:nucleotide exchange factor GrpE n=1 Tax=Virgifigura deserti TaxID=2268457 RepID=UPI000E673D07